MIPSKLVLQLIFEGIRAARPSKAATLKIAGLLALAITAVFPAFGHAQAAGNNGQTAVIAPADPATGAPGKMTFDAASVRPSMQKFVLKGLDFLGQTSDAPPPPGGLFSWNVPVGYLIVFAYDLRGSQEIRDLSESLPKWAQMQGDWYTVEARAEGNPTRDEVRQMVQSLLEERFQLAAHIEKRDGQVYALIVDKPAQGLKPHPEGAPCTLTPAQTDENRYPHAYPSYKQFPVHCGVFNRQLSRAGDRRLEMLNVTMQQIADSISSGAPMSGGLVLSVIDRTGLAGHYDALLDFDQHSAIPPDLDTSDDLGLPELPVALEKQLGLKLVKQNAQVDVFVLDHIAPLSEN